jgi:lipopolysaccharide transport system ATP-binding protein
MPADNIAIKVTDLSKVYPLYNSPKDRLKEALHPLRKKFHNDFYALNNVSFEVKKGETFGIIGQNGSGKSTLLKIISNVLSPSSGEVLVNGKVSSLLELGTGFNPELSGIENVYFNGTLLGFTKEEMDSKLDEILSFADIGEFIRQPVKTYSSGMYVRLAFSVATQIDPDILIVDEALSVGDMFFQAKCISRMKKMIDNEGTTLLLVSHTMDTVKALCSKAILLNKGQMLMNGSAVDVAQKYFELRVLSQQDTIQFNTDRNQIPDTDSKTKNISNPYQGFLIPSEIFTKSSSFQRIQNGKAEFLNVVLLDEFENVITNVKYGQTVILRLVIKVLTDINLLGFGYRIIDQNGIAVVNGTSSIANKGIVDLIESDIYIIDFKFTLKIRQGNYTIACITSIPINSEISEVDFCDIIPIACQFEMERRYPSPIYGLVCLENEIEIHKIAILK